MKSINHHTFCAAPWFMIRNTNRGAYTPCCVFDSSMSTYAGKKHYDSNHIPEEWLESDYLNYVRNNLVNGNKIVECQDCWIKEAHGMTSQRQIYNLEILGDVDINNTWAQNFFKYNDIAKFGMVIWADFKNNNICNLSCVMCNPDDSSLLYAKWITQQDNEFVKDYIQKNVIWFDEISSAYKTNITDSILDWILKQPHLKMIKFLGGEPLLDKNLILRLQSLDLQLKNKLKLMFVTNGTVDIKPMIDSLQEFKHLHFSVSVEGVGVINDYIRKGSDWSIIEKNILSVQQNKKVKISLIHTLQALTLPFLPDLLQWAKKHNIDISYNLLDYPEYLSIGVLESKIIDNVVISISDDHPVKKYLLDKKDSTHLQQKMLNFVEWYEKDSKVKLKDISVWFDNLIKEKYA